VIIETTSDAIAMPMSIPGLNSLEDESPPLLVLTLPLLLVGSDVGATAVAAGDVSAVAVLTLVEVAIDDSVVVACAKAGKYPACEQ
jgi:hypothetical protein